MVRDSGTSANIEVPAEMFQFLQSRLSVIPRQETSDLRFAAALRYRKTEICLSYGNRTRINAILTDASRAVASENFPRLASGTASLNTLISLMRDKNNRYMRLEGETSSVLLTSQSRN